ncbi:MAG: restriction endonuclease, partial [Oscillospiraceae bacterium]|nr:restriction endonuclease [Oscillospiraceae bacterium]
GKGDSDSRKQHVRELLNFFPVIGEDEDGKMTELDAEKVLSIPRKIRSLEVVRRGFMSNFLFQNIGNIFGAPQEVIDIIQQFEPVSEGELVGVSKEEREKVSVDENGEIKLDEDLVIGRTKDVFGEKIYSQIAETIETKTAEIVENTPEKKIIDSLKETFKTELVNPVMEMAVSKYGSDLNSKDEKKIKKQLEIKTDSIVIKEVGDFNIRKNEIEIQREEALTNLAARGQSEAEVNAEFNALITEAKEKFRERISEKLEETLPALTTEVVRNVETRKQERQKDTIEDAVRNHLRGFTRTIPSFLMAYGDENTTLKNFDTIIPDEVFREVTSITLDEFRFIRDGGDYTDADTGEKKHYQGNLFDEVVFNDSVKEFLALKERLADYFDESHDEDIFDYIPPQKTNQIFTPKKIVKQMVDMLETENPGCFDDPEKTFADLYMKSGLYITEIVKRLYNSPKITECYPDREERLDHIFSNQVYGLAPTEIIYRIALSFILGFDGSDTERRHNFRMLDALPYAKEGTLEKKLDEVFR